MNNLPEKGTDAPKRVTWNLIWTDFLNVMNFERGIFFTIKGLITSPKETVDDYLYGNRKMHANPIRFLLFSTALVTLLNFYLIVKPNLENGTFTQTGNSTYFDLGQNAGKNVSLGFAESMEENNDEIKTDSLSLGDKSAKKSLSEKDKQRVVRESLDKLFSWMDKLTFAMVPIFGFFTFLFFRSSGYNFTENLAISAFMISVNNVIETGFILPTYFAPMVSGSIATVVTVIFMMLFIYNVFAERDFKGFLKSLLALIVSYFVFVITMGGALVYFVLDSI